MVDPRRVVGNNVTAKAIHVTSEIECHRRYGAQKKTKMLIGTVVEVKTVRDPKKSRTTTTIVADYELGGGTTRRKELNLVSVKVVPAADQPIPPPNVAVVAVAPETPDFPVLPNVDAQPTNNDAQNSVIGNVEANNNNDTNTAINDMDNIEEASTDSDISRHIRQFDLNADDNEVAPPTNRPVPAATVNDFDWYDDPNACLQQLNGPVYKRDWQVQTTNGDTWTDACNVDESISRLDVFLQMFPPEQMQTMLRCTNHILIKESRQPTTSGELLKYIGIIILATKFEFTKRSSLWSVHPIEKYEPAPNFGRTGMNRNRFDELTKCLRFSNQHDTRPEDMTSERYRWLLVDDFVKNYNDHRAVNFRPSQLICVDESMSRWYGQGGSWINIGLPNYVAIDRKPENGCEIQTAACGISGVMIRLKLVKSAEEMLHTQEPVAPDNNEELLHGTKVLKELLEPWFHSQRVVCADSYFASVGACLELQRLGMRFIGVVKTATKRFPMRHLSNLEFTSRGERKGLVSKNADGRPHLMAYVWLDRERRYFISSAYSLQEGAPFVRNRWRQVEQDRFTPPENQELTIPQPQCCELYYSCCARVDQHNRDRQDTLQIERKLRTHDWSTRVNHSILSMILVDCWKVYSKITLQDNGNCVETQKEFYSRLATELIDNTYDRTRFRRRRTNMGDAESPDAEFFHPQTQQPRCGASIHLTPTRRKRKNRQGEFTRNTFQGRCMICRQKTQYQCSFCKDENTETDVGWLCHTKNGKTCFVDHIAEMHRER
jgi:Transposase IS4